MMNRRLFLKSGMSIVALSRAARALGDSAFFRGEVPNGPFLPFWESLKSYRCPDWFRDAKFGIWAHWDPQCVPERGLVCPEHVHSGVGAIRISRKALRSSFKVWIQRHLPSMEA